MTSNLSPHQWEQVKTALHFYIQEQTKELQRRNVGDKEWQNVVDYENTLRDIEYYVIIQGQ